MTARFHRRRSRLARVGIAALEVVLALVGAASCIALGLGGLGVLGVSVVAVVAAGITRRARGRRAAPADETLAQDAARVPAGALHSS